VPSHLCPCPPHHHLSESLYQLLSQTSPENMHRNVAQYGLDPATRYPNLNLRAVTPNQVRPPETPHPQPGFPSQPPFLRLPLGGVSPTTSGPLHHGPGGYVVSYLEIDRDCLRYETYMTWWPKSWCGGKVTRQMQGSLSQVSRPPKGCPEYLPAVHRRQPKPCTSGQSHSAVI
jgi:hypothetical protein